MEGAEALTEKISAQKDIYESDDKLYKLHMKGKCLFIFMSVCPSVNLSVFQSVCSSLSLSFSVFSAQKDIYESDDKLYKLHMKGKCLFVSMLSICLTVSFCLYL